VNNKLPEGKQKTQWLFALYSGEELPGQNYRSCCWLQHLPKTIKADNLTTAARRAFFWLLLTQSRKTKSSA
jgi:hypothetical protein